ncbi:MAG: cadherin domain-containing protein [Cyanobacteria bacterium J06597_1]
MADFILEAEDLISVTGYRRENSALASGGSLLGLRGNGGGEVGSASFTFSGDAGVYDIIIGTFDESDGEARFELSSNGSQLGQVVLDQNLGGIGISVDTQVERTIASGISIAAGDSFTLTGFEQAKEHARFDFIRFVQVGATQPSLTLAFDADSISENGGTATATLTRTGDLTASVTVTLSSSDTSAATVPATIEIPAGQESVQFQVTGVNNDDVDGTQSATISATAAGLTAATSDLDVTDDDVPPSGDAIQIEAESIDDNGRYRLKNSNVASGGQLLSLGGGGSNETGIVNFAFDGDAGVYDIVLGVFDEDDGEASFSLAQNGNAIGSIVLDQDLGGSGASASTQVERVVASGIQIGSGDSFTLTGVENEGEQARFDFIRFVRVGSAPPSLSLAIEAESISENGGTTTATLTRTGDLSSAVTVTLNSSDTTAATVPSTIVIPVGESSVQFQIAGVDDDAVDGIQTSTISATATGFTGASDDIDVTDDDTPPSGDVFRIEAEDIEDTTRFRLRSSNLVSGGELLSLQGGSSNETGTAMFTFDGATGVYNIILGTVEEDDGEASFSITQNGTALGSIVLDQDLGGSGLSADTLVERLLATSVQIATGDSFTLTGMEDGGEQARFDFIQFVQVGDIPESAPTFLTPAEIEVTENQTFVLDINTRDVNGDSEANGGLTYSLTGGSDRNLFTLNTSTGVLRFEDAPDFENPGDSNGNNLYRVDVTVTDSTGRSSEQELTIRVGNELEGDSSGNAPVFLGNNGRVVIEAESIAPNGDWVPLEVDGEDLYLYTGPNSFGRARAEQQLEYRFTTDESGLYSIAVHGARDNSLVDPFENDRGNDLFVGIENAETGEVIQRPTKFPTFFRDSNLTLKWGTTFSVNAELGPARVNLDANTEYRLLLTGRSTGYAVDRITLRNGGFLRSTTVPQSEIESNGGSGALDALLLEAEDATLTGDYRVESNDIASDGQLVGLSGGSNNEQGSTTFGFNDTPGSFDVVLGVFDENDGISNFVVSLNDAETGTTTQLASIQLDSTQGSDIADEASALLRTVATGVSLTSGDTITVTGSEDNGEPALLDFLQLTPSSI